MPESTKAVFLSYASQDADAARRICDALRAAGLEVWFDQSELRGGDAWDASIRKQIKECALFVPMISAITDARSEGYFRLEWKLAVDRSHLMAENKAFFVPVILGDISEPNANVPDAFRTRQWSRLNDENAISAFAARVAKLVDGSASSGINAPKGAPVLGNSPQGTERIPGRHATVSSRIAPKKVPGSLTGYRWAIVVGVIAIVGLGAYVLTQNKPTTVPAASTTNDGAKTSTINPLSVMVMPFANQTGDAQKAYIANALTSSITSDLSRIRDAFIVPATTAFSLQDKKLTVPQLGKEAAVRFILNGSVTGNSGGNTEKLRITAALSDTQTGAQLWTENFDGKQTELFALQDQVTKRIGDTIAPQMVILAARESEKRASTPQVADLLMRARALGLNQQSLAQHQAMEALYRQVLAIEPGNLSAKAGLAVSLGLQAANFANPLKLDEAGKNAILKKAFDLAQEVKAIDSNNPDIYTPISIYYDVTNDIEAAMQAINRRIELQPKATGGYSALGRLKRRIDDVAGAKAAFAKSLEFASHARPPVETYMNLAHLAFREDKLDDAIVWARKGLDANPLLPTAYATMAQAYARKGDIAQAKKAAAEAMRLDPNLRLGNNIIYGGPWPGKEAVYAKFMETQFIPAWRAAGLPE